MYENIERALRHVSDGGMIIVTDDADRENEGDLIMAAEKATPEQIAFIIRHTSGILCTPVEVDHARRLNLWPMVAENDAPHSTAFTVSVDYKKDLTTGISAQERCNTVNALGRLDVEPSDLVRPGHVFPLIAREGGLLMRTGHTEAAVDLAKLAGCTPVGLLAELVNDDGSVKTGTEIDTFAKEHDLIIVSIDELISYRQAQEVLIERVEETDIETKYGPARAIVYSSRFDEAHHVAVRFGDPSKTDDVLVRFQLEDVMEDVFGGEHSGVHAAMKRLADEGNGVLVYLRLGAAGVTETSEDRADDGTGRQSDNARLTYWKDIGLGAQILRDMGLTSIRLLASRERQYVGLHGFGLKITKTEPFS